MNQEFTSMFHHSISLRNSNMIDHESPRASLPIPSSPFLVPFEDNHFNIINASSLADPLDQQSSTCSSWINGDYECLPEIPLLYPIERTNTIVQCSNPHQIADRIIRSLQKLSITANFNASDVSRAYEFIN